MCVGLPPGDIGYDRRPSRLPAPAAIGTDVFASQQSANQT